ncbi:hypothetical protein B0J13DRAFT_563440 [Dactylonectria estremocensis]|uniref:Zn(2)-C6 fungal-type domain-containing protein n=1 Tax=Dactylonectria estremocensis TaxID=1079267 RepID=A0A9P9E0C0_9HYPO|nr:hypothetical protein B0J13DRAFT_563440 [Dactylonectria estremocensis]
MDHSEKTQAASTGPVRVLIACVACKTRKIRCDGKTPQCSHCVARRVDCTYAAARRYRGPGKGRKANGRVEDGAERAQQGPSPLPSTNVPNQEPRNEPIDSALLPTENASDSHAIDEVTTHHSALAPLDAFVVPTQTQASVTSRIPIFPKFMLPGTFDAHLKTAKRHLGDFNVVRRFTPLLPQHISTRLVQNSFAEIMADHQLLDLSHFLILLDSQYTASSIEPAEDPARWATVNAFMALAVRHKTAPGSEAELSGIAHGFYQNAVVVLPELILKEPSLLSLQALLSMAMFAEATSDTRASLMLRANASLQLESIRSEWLISNTFADLEENQQYTRVSQVASMLDEDNSAGFETSLVMNQC